MAYQYPQASGTQVKVKSSCNQSEKPITYAEAMRLIESRFGTVNAPIAKRNLEMLMQWYRREGRYSIPKRSEQLNGGTRCEI